MTKRSHRGGLPRSIVWPLVGLTLAWLALGCQRSTLRPFPLAPPMLEDNDRQHVEAMPEPYFSGLIWDFVDQTFFRSLNRYLTVDATRPSVNVNAWDEVPDSSWFENRLGAFELSEQTLARGACPENLLRAEDGPWIVTAAKPNGANPGFIIRDTEGRGWLLKFDGHEQGERATAADVFGSRIYHAAGFHSPCNIIVEFDPSVLEIADDAEAEDARGRDVPMAQHHVQQVLDAAFVLPDGRLRASASLFLPGTPLGPWRYQGTWREDPNDVIPHEDRRELRGARLLAAWLNHFDAREQNTLAIWYTEDDGTQYVKHYYLDFGDCLGSRWAQDGLSRRFGNAYYFDAAEILLDLFSFGLALRPWDTVTVNEEAHELGYFDVEHFDPVRWKVGYPNPAFVRMQAEDGAWMARIIAAFDHARVRAMLDEARIVDTAFDAEVMRVLMARRRLILEHWLLVRSPLDAPRISADGGTVCLDDLAIQTGVLAPEEVRYTTRFFDGTSWDRPRWSETLTPGAGGQSCIPLLRDTTPRPADATSAGAPEGYAILDVVLTPHAGATPVPPLRIHLVDDGATFTIVGIERPGDATPPGGGR